MPQHNKDAFYQLVLFPARAALNVYQTQIYAAASLHYANLGSQEANALAQKACDAFKRDAEETKYYNKTLANGKWDGIMRQNHMSYTAWNSPQIQVISETMPATGTVDNSKYVPKTSLERGKSDQKGQFPANQKNLPPGTYVEQFGYVSINPASFVKSTQVDDAAWEIIHSYGRELDSIKLLPATIGFKPGSPSPATSYSFYIQNPNDYNINIFIAPSNNQLHPIAKPLKDQLRFGVKVDDCETVIANGLPENFDAGHGASWAQGVMDNVRVVHVPHGQLTVGLHSLHIVAIDPGVVIEKIVIAPPNVKQEVINLRPPTSHFMGSYFGPPESDIIK